MMPQQENTYLSTINAIHKELDNLPSKIGFISNIDSPVSSSDEKVTSSPTVLKSELQGLYNRVKYITDNIIV